MDPISVITGAASAAVILVPWAYRAGARGLGRALLEARTDRLTGLANRLALQETMPPICAPTHAVIILDLDGFKAVNDTRGHEAGDEVLRAVADRLRRVCDCRDLVARLGGDEFVVFTEAERAGRLAAAIVAAVDEPVPFDGDALLVRASVGVARPGGPVSGQAMLKTADIAMYAAKRLGGGCVVEEAATAASSTTTARRRPRSRVRDLRSPAGATSTY